MCSAPRQPDAAAVAVGAVAVVEAPDDEDPLCFASRSNSSTA